MIVLDIETVPQEEYLTDPPEWFKASKFFPTPKLKDLNEYKKDETKEKYRLLNEATIANFDIERIKELSVLPYTAKPIVMCNSLWGGTCLGEPRISRVQLRDMLSDISRHLPLVTAGGKNFDIPLMIAWCAKNGWSQEAQMWAQYATSPYQHSVHLDLLTLFPKYPSLDELGHFLGCKTEKYGDGSDVYQWYIAGEMDKIVKHCQADVALTAECAERLGVV